MTQLKHIVVIVVLLITIGFSAIAQSTALRPYEGATHSYNFSGLPGELDYNFFITESNDLRSERLDDIVTGEFDYIGASSGTIGVGENTASVQIGWNNGASLHIYYVWLQVTGSSGCSNYRHVEVVPQVNDFDMLSHNVPVENTRSCPALTSEGGFNPSASGYEAGFTTLQFRVIRENGTDNKLTAMAGDTYEWSFIPSLTVNPDLTLGKVIISIQGTSSGVITPDAGNRYNISGLDSEVLVTVSIENAPGYTRDVQFEVTEQRESNTNLSDGDPSNDAVIHTIEVMPVISGMGGV